MLINYVPGEECRIVIVEGGRLEEYYQERAGAELHVGNIYKGRVVGVEPSIQAVFIDFGLDRNGFLHITDLHPMYFPGQWKEESERVGQKTPHRDRPPIQNCLRRGQEILVQVLKEGIGTKGPTLTSYLSIPGRFLVMMPHMHRLGVSRKVEDEETRREMRKILDELKPPDGFGFIIRTAGMGHPKTELKRDLAYLQRLWKAIETRRKKTPDVGELYTESDLIIRTIRDVFTSQIKRIVVDHVEAARRARNFLAVANPRAACKISIYQDPIPIFHRYGIEPQIDHINARQVPLPSGGSLVIDSAEAMVAIDVNSGKNRENRDAETTAYKTNIEAAKEVCRQLRLRDLGGVVAIDLIDMRLNKHRRDIEQRFRQHLRDDRARTRVGTISQFGVLEMTRQRMRPSLKKSIYIDCPACQGSGQVKSPESVVLDVMRRLALTLHQQQVAKVELTISPDVAFVLLNEKRAQVVALENHYHKQVTVRVGGQAVDYIQITAFNTQGVAIDAQLPETYQKPKLVTVDDWVDESASGEQDPSTPPLPDEPSPLSSDDGSVQDDPSNETATDDESRSASSPRRRRRRRGGRRRGKKSASTEPIADAATGDPIDQGPPAPTDPVPATASDTPAFPESSDHESDPSGVPVAVGSVDRRDDAQQTPSSTSRPKRRRRRSGSNRKKKETVTDPAVAGDQDPSPAASTSVGDETAALATEGSQPQATKKKSRSRRRPRRKPANRSPATNPQEPGSQDASPIAVKVAAQEPAVPVASEAVGG